jgi:hypothetical protein
MADKEPTVDLSSVTMEEMVREINSRHVAAVVLTLNQQRGKVKEGTNPGYELVIASTQSHGAIAVLLQGAIQVNTHQFFVSLNQNGVTKA